MAAAMPSAPRSPLTFFKVEQLTLRYVQDVDELELLSSPVLSECSTTDTFAKHQLLENGDGCDLLLPPDYHNLPDWLLDDAFMLPPAAVEAYGDEIEGADEALLYDLGLPPRDDDLNFFPADWPDTFLKDGLTWSLPSPRVALDHPIEPYLCLSTTVVPITDAPCANTRAL